jgi:hypothetical protein
MNQTTYDAQCTKAPPPAQGAAHFTKRLGTTTYRVGVHFSRTSCDTARDKIARLVRREAGGKEAG